MSYIFVREPLNGEEYDRIVNACQSFQEKLVTWLLLDTEIRVNEFCNLKRKDIQWQENTVIVWGKGGWYGRRGKRRVVPLVSTASLKKILGHDRLETTEIYLNICPEDALNEFFRKIEGNR